MGRALRYLACVSLLLPPSVTQILLNVAPLCYRGKKVEDPETIEAIRGTVISNLLKYHPVSTEPPSVGLQNNTALKTEDTAGSFKCTADLKSGALKSALPEASAPKETPPCTPQPCERIKEKRKERKRENGHSQHVLPLRTALPNAPSSVPSWGFAWQFLFQGLPCTTALF